MLIVNQLGSRERSTHTYIANIINKKYSVLGLAVNKALPLPLSTKKAVFYATWYVCVCALIYM